MVHFSEYLLVWVSVCYIHDFMIIETLPDIQNLTKSEKEVLARELLDELNAPETSPDQDAAILDLLNQRYEAYISGEEEVSSWKEVQSRLKAKTGASWQM